MTRSVNINSLETDAKKVTGPEIGYYLIKKSTFFYRIIMKLGKNDQLINW